MLEVISETRWRCGRGRMVVGFTTKTEPSKQLKKKDKTQKIQKTKKRKTNKKINRTTIIRTNKLLIYFSLNR
jgi:hypothetical protein